MVRCVGDALPDRSGEIFHTVLALPQLLNQFQAHRMPKSLGNVCQVPKQSLFGILFD